jgi:ABC-type sugar transport system permease subunit
LSKIRYLVLLPLAAILAAVEVYPLLVSVYFSFTNYNTGGIFVGLDNYIQAFSSPEVYYSIGISVAYAVGSTLLCIVFGLVLAFIIIQLKRGKSFFESVFLLPLAVAPISVGIVWSPSGFWDDINTFWHFILGLPYIDFTNFYIVFPIIVWSDAWEWAPIIMLVALSVVSGVPKEIFEAASLHGGSALQVFRRIAVPTILKSRVMQFMIVLRLIDALRAFEIPFAWSSWLSLPNAGSPIDTISLLLFKLFSVPVYGFPISLISAIAVVLLLITLATTTVLYSFMKRMGKA